MSSRSGWLTARPFDEDVWSGPARAAKRVGAGLETHATELALLFLTLA